MTKEEAEAAIAQLLDGLSDEEVRVLCIEALRKARREGKIHDGQFALHSELGATLVPLFATRKRVQLGLWWNAGYGRDTFIERLERPFMTGVFEFVTWFFRAGLGWPLQCGPGGNPIRVRLTRAGGRVLAIEGDDHPLSPGFVERVVGRCPDLPESTTSLLIQSRACLDHGLMQPAISLMGVACECAVELSLRR